MDSTIILPDDFSADITIRRKIKWRSCALTDVGTSRKVNEDSLLDKSKFNLWVIADGMGGYEAGDVASNMIVTALDEIEYLPSFDDSLKQIEQVLRQINSAIIEFQKESLEQKMMGSTVMCLLIRGRLGGCLWAGDSRLYRLRNASLIQISRDHSYVEELIQQGLLTESEAINHQDSNVITRAVGATDTFSIESKVFNTEVGDSYLLCSDGLYNAVDFKGIERCLHSVDIKTGAQQLLDSALNNNASDNVSLVLIRGEIDKTTNNSPDEK